MNRISRLERLRRKRGLTQNEIAHQAGVNQPLISMIETKKLKPYPRIKKELSRILDCSEDYLFGKD